MSWGDGPPMRNVFLVEATVVLGGWVWLCAHDAPASYPSWQEARRPSPARVAPARLLPAAGSSPVPTRTATDSWWSPVTVRTGEHFRVSCEFEDEALTTAALEAAEAAWPATLAILGCDPPAPLPGPMEVRLIRSRGDYRAEDADRLSFGRLKHATGWADNATRTAWVALDGCGIDPEISARFGPSTTFRMVVTHEAAHLVANRCVPASGGCPWFDEGIAEMAEERLLAGRTPADAAPENPVLAQSMHVCRKLVDDGRLPSPRDILDGRLELLPGMNDHSVAWAFLRFLDEPPFRERTRQIFEEARRMGNTCKFPDGIAREFEAAFAGRLDELADAWTRYAASLAPAWTQDSGWGLDVRGRRWIQFARPGSGAISWRAERAGRTSYRIDGSFEILDRATKNVAVVLGRTADGGYVGVEFQPGHGVGVYRSAAGSGTTKWMKYERSNLVATGAPLRFVVEVAGDDIRVLVRGHEALHGSVAGLDVTGNWGVAAFEGSAVVWDGVSLQ